eukprot:scaffold20686_cov79-Phaeocystis_antarctica.AAC.3
MAREASGWNAGSAQSARSTSCRGSCGSSMCDCGADLGGDAAVCPSSAAASAALQATHREHISRDSLLHRSPAGARSQNITSQKAAAHRQPYFRPRRRR